MLKVSNIIFIASLLIIFFPSANAFELPIWGKEAREKGYVLPEPYGISLGEMHVKQGIEVDKINLQDLSIPFYNVKMDHSSDNLLNWFSKLFPLHNGLDKYIGKGIPQGIENKRVALPANLIEATKGNGYQKTDVRTLRFDTWIFPFFNLYAIVGKMNGYSQTKVKLNKKALQTFIEKNANKDSLAIYQKGLALLNARDIAFDFKMDLDSTLYGGGFVLAGGVGNVFTLIDASYTQTKLSAVNGQIDAIVISPRLGYNFTNDGVPLKIWAGGMFQDVEQHLQGYISKLGIDQNISAIVDPENKASFVVDQHIQSPWNTLVGFTYQLAPKMNLIAEAGLGKRRSMMLSMDYRF